MEFITKYKSRLFWHGYIVEVVHPADQNKKLRLKVTRLGGNSPLHEIMIKGLDLVTKVFRGTL